MLIVCEPILENRLIPFQVQDFMLEFAPTTRHILGVYQQYRPFLAGGLAVDYRRCDMYQVLFQIVQFLLSEGEHAGGIIYLCAQRVQMLAFLVCSDKCRFEIGRANSRVAMTTLTDGKTGLRPAEFSQPFFPAFLVGN